VLRRATDDQMPESGVGYMVDEESARRLAESVRDACLRAALEAYENAGVSGLCEEGRWECAVGAIRALDLDMLLGAPARRK
jgi:hypothetical protein